MYICYCLHDMVLSNLVSCHVSFRIDWPEEFPQQLCELSQWTVDCLVIYKCERISWLDISSCASVQGKTSPNIMRTGDLVSRQPVFNISMSFPCLIHVLWHLYGYIMDIAWIWQGWIRHELVRSQSINQIHAPHSDFNAGD